MSAAPRGRALRAKRGDRRRGRAAVSLPHRTWATRHGRWLTAWLGTRPGTGTAAADAPLASTDALVALVPAGGASAVAPLLAAASANATEIAGLPLPAPAAPAGDSGVLFTLALLRECKTRAAAPVGAAPAAGAVAAGTRVADANTLAATIMAWRDDACAGLACIAGSAAANSALSCVAPVTARLMPPSVQSVFRLAALRAAPPARRACHMPAARRIADAAVATIVWRAALSLFSGAWLEDDRAIAAARLAAAGDAPGAASGGAAALL